MQHSPHYPQICEQVLAVGEVYYPLTYNPTPVFQHFAVTVPEVASEAQATVQKA